MALSGSIDYSLTARELITYALKKIRVVAAGETPSAEDMQDSLEDLNLMLKGLQLRSPNLWRQTVGTVTLVAATASYTLSPRPFRVTEARYRDANGRDLPMEEWTRQEYYDMPVKTNSGIPTAYYVDHQRSTATMYIWSVPSSVTTETIQYTYQRVFQDLDSVDNDIDIPQEHMDTIGYALADRLMETFGVDDPRITRRAAYLMAIADSADREGIVRFEPGRR